MIVFDYRPPSPQFQEYVRQYQIVGFSFPGNVVVPVKSYWPRPENCLAFYPRDTVLLEHIDGRIEDWKPRSTLIGQHTSVTHRRVGNDFILFQIVFQPGALCRLTGIPGSELTNSFVDAESVFAPEIQYVNERLSSADNHLDMIAIVETFLGYLVRRHHSSKNRILPVDKVSQFMLQHHKHGSFGWPSLDWLASQACLSSRQFYHQFSNRLGVSPKLFSRIVRFDQAVKFKNAFSHKDWLTIALELGYYDYQHLARDYKDFTKLTPTEFFQKENKAPERTFGNTEK